MEAPFYGGHRQAQELCDGRHGHGLEIIEDHYGLDVVLKLRHGVAHRPVRFVSLDVLARVAPQAGSLIQNELVELRGPGLFPARRFLPAADGPSTRDGIQPWRHAFRVIELRQRLECQQPCVLCHVLRGFRAHDLPGDRQDRASISPDQLVEGRQLSQGRRDGQLAVGTVDPDRCAHPQTVSVPVGSRVPCPPF